MLHFAGFLFLSFCLLGFSLLLDLGKSGLELCYSYFSFFLFLFHLFNPVPLLQLINPPNPLLIANLPGHHALPLQLLLPLYILPLLLPNSPSLLIDLSNPFQLPSYLFLFLFHFSLFFTLFVLHS